MFRPPPSTADLQLLESNWPDIASPTAQDALLEQLTRLRALADQLTTDGPLAPLTRLGYDDNGRHVTLLDRFVTEHPQLVTELYRIHYHAIAAVSRELRLTADRTLAAAGAAANPDFADIDPTDTPETLPEPTPAAAQSITSTDPHQTTLNGTDHPAPIPPDTEPAPLGEEAQFLSELITDFPGAPEEHQEFLKELETQLAELGHLPAIAVPTPQ